MSEWDQDARTEGGQTFMTVRGLNFGRLPRVAMRRILWRGTRYDRRTDDGYVCRLECPVRHVYFDIECQAWVFELDSPLQTARNIQPLRSGQIIRFDEIPMEGDIYLVGEGWVAVSAPSLRGPRRVVSPDECTLLVRPVQ